MGSKNPTYQPVVVTPTNRAVLFLDPAQATPDVSMHLGLGVDGHPYAAGFDDYLTGLAA
ncbi:hypothetical protein K488DRAFT_82993 [Vararia minispora EC-137]|uniref:Uncharacterized protein n=1 Tax=Vararia minispora EC-137 TaxID=1314806 RepID=A0ACB8QUQ2_9AGAM|nr:hypothetical protein K488DRAFT_82993 [Vararia minispora EC-137]